MEHGTYCSKQVIVRLVTSTLIGVTMLARYESLKYNLFSLSALGLEVL